MSQIDIIKLDAGYGKKKIVQDISFSLKKGEILTLLGANGQGKTTLLKTICGLQDSLGGEVEIGGKNRKDFSLSDLARQIAFVPQSHRSGLPFTVREMVVLGRMGNKNLFSRPGKSDYAHTDKVLEMLGLDSRADKNYLEMSGGEQRMVLIARALNQEARFIFLDEPVSHLDLGNQIKVLSVLNSLSEQGIAIMMTSHFPEHSLWLRAKTAIIQGGRLTDLDRADKVLTSEKLTEIYGTPISVITHGDSKYCEPHFVKDIMKERKI
ncbi:MAG: ABC transporter ATP-binding protein [Spirochaetales bacterium]|nr:ABC transporter ATP-binding protein [Spirochaetales bacterium]